MKGDQDQPGDWRQDRSGDRSGELPETGRQVEIVLVDLVQTIYTHELSAREQLGLVRLEQTWQRQRAPRLGLAVAGPARAGGDAGGGGPLAGGAAGLTSALRSSHLSGGQRHGGTGGADRADPSGDGDRVLGGVADRRRRVGARPHRVADHRGGTGGAGGWRRPRRYRSSRARPMDRRGRAVHHSGHGNCVRRALVAVRRSAGLPDEERLGGGHRAAGAGRRDADGGDAPHRQARRAAELAIGERRNRGRRRRRERRPEPRRRRAHPRREPIPRRQTTWARAPTTAGRDHIPDARARRSRAPRACAGAPGRTVTAATASAPGAGSSRKVISRAS